MLEVPKISVIIPVKNEGKKIKECIEGILFQSVPVHEIIVIDSGSTDETLPILTQYEKVRVIEIDPENFNHGETRNLGTSEATGDYLLFTVGDARAFDKNWIQELLRGFENSDAIAICGQQVVPSENDKNPLEWFRAYSDPELIYHQFKSGEFKLLEPEVQKNICGWDDVNAMYKKSALQTIPFQKTAYSEDAIWANEVLSLGYKIGYNYKARVYHYHLENSDFTYKRTFTTIYFRYRLFKFIYPAQKLTLKYKISVLKTLVKRLGLSIDVFKWYRYSISNFKAAQKAIHDFKTHLNQGEDALDNFHEKICGKPPIPIK